MTDAQLIAQGQAATAQLHAALEGWELQHPGTTARVRHLLHGAAAAAEQMTASATTAFVAPVANSGGTPKS